MKRARFLSVERAAFKCQIAKYFLAVSPSSFLILPAFFFLAEDVVICGAAIDSLLERVLRECKNSGQHHYY